MHAHKEQCFFRYAPSLIPGAATVCGEIMGSLWSVLNGISPSTRTATLAHRTEILDDHACDSNHRKLLGITKFLIRRHKHSLENLEASEKYLNQLTRGADPLNIEHWQHKIETAEATRLDNPTVMDVYGSRGSRGNSTIAEPPAQPDHSEPLTATELWLHMALMIEERQSVTHSIQFPFL